jgi:antirestriction protein ArdC
MPTKTVRDAAAETTKSILEALESGTVPWHQPWSASSYGLPMSLSTGRPYRGVNVFLLMLEGASRGYTSSHWGTYRQIQERGGQVRKGEKSAQIVFWKLLKKDGEIVNGKPTVRTIPLLRLYHVFNVDQCDWSTDARLPAPAAERTEVEAIAAAADLVNDYLTSGPSLSHGGDRAYYAPPRDAICLPQRDDFVSAEHYYSTLYHEITHSTGHTSRLARQGIAEGTFGGFGSPVYSFEELVAEMGAAMLCGLAGINQAAVIPSSAGYIAHWLDVLRGDAGLVIKAAAQAQKAVDRVVGTTFETDEDS